MKANLKLVAAVAVLLLVVGVMVWPTPKKAWAQNVSVTMPVTWGDGVNRYDIGASSELLHSDGTPFNPVLSIQLQDDGTHSTFSGTFVDPPSQAAKIRFSWNENGWDWFSGGVPIASPYTITFNWSGTTFNALATGNW